MARDFLYCEETDTRIYPDDVVTISSFPDIKFIAKQGWYRIGTANKNGWYFINIVDRSVIPIDQISIQDISKDIEQGTSEYRPTLKDIDAPNPINDYLVIPGTNIRLYDSDIVKISSKPRIKWVVHIGWYIYEGNQNFGWYFVSIKDGTILPASIIDLTLCTLVTTKTQGSEKYDGKAVNYTRPFTLEDADILNRTFITVDTIEQRDNLDKKKLVNGRLVRVNDVGGVAAYYRWDAETKSWVKEDFGGGGSSGGIPEVVGTTEHPIVLSVLEPGLYRILGTYKISPNTRTTAFTNIDHIAFVSNNEDINIKVITDFDITDYIVSEDEIVFIDKYATQEYIADNYATIVYVDNKIAILEAQISQIIDEFDEKVLEIVNNRLNDALDRVSENYIDNLFD